MVLNEECKGALNYDYVIGTSEGYAQNRTVYKGPEKSGRTEVCVCIYG